MDGVKRQEKNLEEISLDVYSSTRPCLVLLIINNEGG